MEKEILNKTFKDNQLDAIISLAYQTRLWYAKVSTSDGIIFIEPNRADLIVDGRYIEYAQKESKNVSVLLLTKEFEKFVKSKKYMRIGIESDYLTIDEQSKIKMWFPKATLVPISGQFLRIIKSADEIELLKKAGDISIKAIKAIETQLVPGTAEREIDHLLNFEMKKLGANKESFDSIVVSGARGALPHGSPSSKKLAEGELVTVDFGVLYKGYMSDVTRTFRVGSVTNPKLLEIEKILRKSQKLGIEAVRPGASTYAIDKICRDYITKKGYGEFFLHSTGHGLGIDIHELPVITSNKVYDAELEEGMVITIEPGIYIEGLGGIRIEDDILVTKTGYTILSK